MPASATKRVRQRTRLTQITDFLAQRRLALIGLSHNPHDITRELMRELEQRGYEVVPVNPHLDQVGERKCFAQVQEIQPPVQAAMIYTAAEVTEQVLHDCAAAGITQIWIRAGLERLTPEAIAFCAAQHLEIIAGECPFMFLPGANWVHQLHGFGRKVTGRYPR